MTSAGKTPALKRKKPLLDRRDEFLQAFRACCSITEAAEALKISRSLHYRWMEEPEYRRKFEGGLPEAGGVLEDTAVRLASRGAFEPTIYKGELCYQKRQRVMCRMKDGSTAFLDELSKRKRAQILDRKTVVTKDGEQIGIFRPDTALLAKLLTAWMPEKYAPKVFDNDNDSDPPPHVVHIQQR